MSGVKNLANAVANDPSFMSKVKGYSKQELSQFVPQGNPKSAGMSTPKMNMGKKYGKGS
jgi:hypothetical protein